MVVLWAALFTPALAHSCSGIPDEECDALYALYYSTGGDHWADNTNWLSNEPVWNWYGITFGAGNVMGIRLGGNGLTGLIPVELANFSNLWTLSLGYNRIGGSIPPELGSLTTLQLLSLSSNNLSGEIPPELGELIKLERLGLAYNNFTGPIPPELGNLSKLERLELFENELSGSIPLELGNLTGLSIFMLRNNELTGTIPPELSALTEIDDLDLSRNKLSGEIPPELGTMTWLRSLTLSFNKLTGPIPAELGNLNDLIALLLNSNNLCGDLPSFLATPTDRHIDFRYNRLYASSGAVLAQMEVKHDGKFLSTQTLPPKNITTATVEDSGNSENRVHVSWSPIKYIDDSGGYQAFYSKTGEEDFHYSGMTRDKETTSLMVSNLEPGVEYDFWVKSVTWNHGWNGNSLYSEDSDTAVASAGNIHRAFIPVWKQSPEYFTGVVVSNFGDEDFDLTLTAWDSSGHKEPLGTNPAICNIGPSHQKSLLGVEFFNGNPSHEDSSWIELGVENSRDLGSIFLFGVNDTQLLDGAEAQYRYAKNLYFTRPLEEGFFGGWDPDIQMSIVNPTDQEVRIICWLRGSSRDFGQSHIIPPRGFVTGNAKELVPLYYDVTNGYMEIEVTDGPGVIGYSRVEFPGVRTALGMNAVESHQSEKMYSAQLAHGSNIVTNLQLVNTYDGLRNVKLTPIADDGSTLAAPVWIPIP
ncbi:MAG: fibronectin type III domain-containing protein, partial [Acidobacteriota bacterium]